MATLFSEHFQAQSSTGAPLAGALLYFYQSGTTTPITTYADAGETTPSTTVVQSDATSAIVADASGMFAPIFVTGSTAYKIVLKTAALAAVQTIDGITPPITLSTQDQSVTGGARIVTLAHGTKSSGTFTPDPGDRPVQSYTNGGAHTLAPGTNYGSYRLDITNNASAGAITTSGWTKVTGTFATTNGHKFMVYCNISEIGSALDVVALQ
jgi:hypothetical protein